MRAPCINAESFWPRAGNSQFPGIGGTQTALPGQVGIGLVTNFSHRPLIALTPSPGLTGSSQAAINNVVTANFLFHVGITDRLQFELVAPISLGRSGAGRAALTGASEAPRNVALHDVRIGLAYAFVRRSRVDVATEVADPKPKGHTYGLTARVEFSAPVGAAAEFARDRTAVFSPSISGDYRRGPWFAAAELGMRIRGNSEFGATRVGSQVFAAVGVGVDVLAHEKLAALVEVRHLIGLTEQRDLFATGDGFVSVPNGKYLVPAEWAVGARSGGWFGGDLSLDLSLGAAIPYGGEGAPTAPAFRLGFGVRYAPLGRDSDADGVPDKVDRCPHEFAQARPGEPRDGCPHAPAPPDAPVEFTSDAAPAGNSAPPPPAPPSPPAPNPDSGQGTTP